MTTFHSSHGFIEVESLGTSDVSIAQAHLKLKAAGFEIVTENEISTTGSSRRYLGGVDDKGVRIRGDHPIPEVGVKLAIADALESMAARLRKEAMGVLDCDEHNRAHAKAAKERGPVHYDKDRGILVSGEQVAPVSAVTRASEPPRARRIPRLPSKRKASEPSISISS